MPDVLSQNAIDDLLKSISSGASIDEIASKADEYAKLKIYDFKRPDKFSKDQLRAIQMIHESFARQMTTVLSTLIRSIVSAYPGEHIPIIVNNKASFIDVCIENPE